MTSLTPTLLPPTSLSSHFTPLLLSMTRVHLLPCLSKLSIPHSSLPDKKKLIYSSQENENWNNKKNTLTPCDISEIDPSCMSTRFIKLRPVFLHAQLPFQYVQWSTRNSLIFKIYTTKTQKASKHIKVFRVHWPKSSWRKQNNVQKPPKWIKIYFQDHIWMRLSPTLKTIALCPTTCTVYLLNIRGIFSFK